MKRVTLAALSVGLVLACSFRFENPAERLSSGEARGRAVIEREGLKGTYDPATGSTVQVRGTVFSVTTRSSGFFTFLDLPVGLVTLVFTQTTPTERTILRDVEVKPTNFGQPDGVIIGDIPLLYTAEVSGVLLDSQGQPVPFASVVDDASQLTATADGAGKFTFPALAVGKHSFRGWLEAPGGGVSLTGGTLEVNVATEDQRGKKAAGTLQLKPASCCGRVKLKVGFIGVGTKPPVSRLKVELRRPDNTTLTLTPDSEGGVDDSNVPEGVYQLSASDPTGAAGYEPAHLERVVVVKGAPTEVGALLLTSLQTIQRARNACGVTADCSSGQVCVNNQCASADAGGEPPVRDDAGAGLKCSAATCAGCCDQDGACSIGTSIGACGEGGQSCVSCATGTSCVAGACRQSGGGDGGAMPPDAGAMCTPMVCSPTAGCSRGITYCAASEFCAPCRSCCTSPLGQFCSDGGEPECGG